MSFNGIVVLVNDDVHSVIKIKDITVSDMAKIRARLRKCVDGDNIKSVRAQHFFMEEAEDVDAMLDHIVDSL